MKTKQATHSIFLLCTFLFLFSCKETVKTPSDSFTVTGTIKGLDTKFMIRSVYDKNGKRSSDSIFVKNGTFTYTAKINKEEHIIFWPNVERTIKRSGRGYYPVKSSQFAFLAKPGDHIVFKGEVTDFINAYPSGTKANDDLAIINSKIFPLMNSSINYLLKKNKLKKEDPRIKVLSDSIEFLDKKVIALKKEFVKSNSSSEAAVWYLSDMMMRKQLPNEAAITIFKNLDESLHNNNFYKEIATRIKGIESTTIGKVVPNFSTNKTLDGNTFTFNSLRGKYVLIDFWGIWCGPCVAEMPTVKKYSEKYADKLTVLGINSGDTKEKIIDFINKKGYQWPHLMSGKEVDNLVLKFNVSGFPTKFIIDPNGKILHRYLGSSEAAFDKLDELLK
ncbi:MAG: AhpC/TSA family protein [Flavobacteriaceae bacterium]|nr:AhpC/TSA family protein [Flavobacteriaceae bacterium]